MELAAVAVGGAIGACLRFAVGLAFGSQNGVFGVVLTTGTANISGSLLLGVLLGYLQSTRAHPLLRPFLAVGVFGSYTTWSALVMENRLLAQLGSESVAVVHLLASLALGLVAFAAGFALGQRNAPVAEEL